MLALASNEIINYRVVQSHPLYLRLYSILLTHNRLLPIQNHKVDYSKKRQVHVAPQKLTILGEQTQFLKAHKTVQQK